MDYLFIFPSWLWDILEGSLFSHSQKLLQKQLSLTIVSWFLVVFVSKKPFALASLQEKEKSLEIRGLDSPVKRSQSPLVRIEVQIEPLRDPAVSF